MQTRKTDVEYQVLEKLADIEHLTSGEYFEPADRHEWDSHLNAMRTIVSAQPEKRGERAEARRKT